MKYLICGNAEMACQRENYQYKESGLDNVFLENVECCRCLSCGEENIHVLSMPNLHRLIGLRLIQKRSLLNGKEIRFLRKNMGLKANETAEIMGVDNATISRWESNTQRMSKPNDRFLRLVYSGMKEFSSDEVRHLIRDRFKEIDSGIGSQEWTILVKNWTDSTPVNPMAAPNSVETKTAGG